MDYFAINLHDWAKYTAGLTPFEKGIFVSLMAHYFATERPLPNDGRLLSRITNTVRRGEAPVMAVLERFYTLTDAGWQHDTWDEEIRALRRMDAKRKKRAEGSAKRQRAWVKRHSIAGNYRVLATDKNQGQTLGMGEPAVNPGKAPEVVAAEGMQNAAEGLQEGGKPEQCQEMAANALSGDVNANHSQNPTDISLRTAAVTINTTLTKSVSSLRSMGFADAAVSDPALIEAVNAGASATDIAYAAAEASARGKPLSWALATAQGRASDKGATHG